MRRAPARFALLGTRICTTAAGETPRQSALLPTPRSLVGSPNPRIALRQRLHHPRRTQRFNGKSGRFRIFAIAANNATAFFTNFIAQIRRRRHFSNFGDFGTQTTQNHRRADLIPKRLAICRTQRGFLVDETSPQRPKKLAFLFTKRAEIIDFALRKKG